MLHTITVLENMDGRELCIAYAYVALSQYYYVLMDFNEVCSLFYSIFYYLFIFINYYYY